MKHVAVLALLLIVGCKAAPPPEDKGKRRPREAYAEAKVGGKSSPDGKEDLNCDLPGSLQEQNVGGSDGAGLCVFDSMHHAGKWQDDPLFSAIFNWMRKHPGGGYPEKVDKMLKQASKELGYPIPAYVQVQDKDDAVLKLASKNGYMLCVTYSRSPTGRYRGRHIDHMVNAAHYSDNWVAILDNNYTGENNYEWMTPDEFKRISNEGGQIWSVILLSTPHPLPPKRKAK